jgi:hypothetical protein
LKKYHWDRFFQIPSVSPVSVIPSSLRIDLASTRCSQQKDERAEAGDFPKVSGLLEMKERWVGQCVNVIVCCSNVALPHCTASHTESSSLYGDHRQTVPPAVKETNKQTNK